MAPSQPTEDFYAVLGIASTASAIEIKRRYRILALERHPDRNGGTKASTVAFQLLNTAHETLSDAVKRADYYRNIWPYLSKANPPHFTPTPTAAPQPPKTNTPPQPTDDDEKHRKDLEAARAHLYTLQTRRNRQTLDKSKPQADHDKLEAELRRFREQDAEDLRKDQADAGWMGWLFGGQTEAAKKQKADRQAARLQRMAASRIKEAALERLRKQLQSIGEGIEKTTSEIVAQGIRISRLESEGEERRRAQKQRQAEEENERWWKEFTERKAKEQREREERVRREEEERRRRQNAAAEEAARREEMARMMREAETRRRQAAERQAADRYAAAERNRREQETAARARREQEASWKQQQSKRNGKTNNTSSCTHRAFWNQIDGAHRCSHCQQVYRRFAFQCPLCNKVACAACRRGLRGEN